MTWNYRVIHHNDDITEGCDTYSIHEVYYKKDNPTSMTVNASYPCGETLEELKDDFEHYKAALDKPVLEATMFV